MRVIIELYIPNNPLEIFRNHLNQYSAKNIHICSFRAHHFNMKNTDCVSFDIFEEIVGTVVKYGLKDVYFVTKHEGNLYHYVIPIVFHVQCK